MDGTDLALVTAIASLIVGAGFLAVAETSLMRMPPTRAAALVADRRRGAGALQELVLHPDRFLNTLLLLALGCQLVAATLVGVLASRHLGPGGVAVATAVEVAVVFVLAEAAPKSWAVIHGERAALLTAPAISALARIAPLRALSGGLVRLANTVLPGPAGAVGSQVSEAELLATADAAVADRSIDPAEHEIIHSVIEFGDTTARQVMVPRTDMVTVDADASFEDALEVVTRSSLSRLPATDGDRDHIAGLLYAKDLLGAVARGASQASIRRLLRPATFVPDTKPAGDLLREMQAGRYHQVLLTNEYGGTAGLVTIEDLIEELVGEIEDEFDRGEPLVEPLAGGVTRVSGTMAAGELEHIIDVPIPAGDWTTVGGLVTGLLGRIPRVGEAAELDGWTLRVHQVGRRRVTTVDVEPKG